MGLFASKEVETVNDQEARRDDDPEVKTAQAALNEAQRESTSADAEHLRIQSVVNPNRRGTANVDEEELLQAREREAEVSIWRSRARLRLLAAQKAHDAALVAHRERLRVERAPRERELRRRQYECAVPLEATTQALADFLEESIALGAEGHAAQAIYFSELVTNPRHESRLDALRADLASRGIEVD